jgi:periplasmic protein TonB
MKRELIIALFVSVGLHLGFVFGGQLFKSAPPAPKPPEEAPTIELIAMPPPEPEVVEQTEPSDEAPADVADLAPPMQNDLPSAVMDSPFTQQIQPPPPPGLARATGSIAIPVGRPGGAIGGNMKNVFDLASLDQKPAPTFQPQPVYPFELKRAGITGTVTVGFIITSAGGVRDPYIISSSNREFEQPAIQGVLKWKFRPGKKAGAAVDARATITIPFTLNSN